MARLIYVTDFVYPFILDQQISQAHTHMRFFPVVSRTHSPKCSIACDQLPTSSFSICSTKGSAASISLACVTRLQTRKYEFGIGDMFAIDLFYLKWGGSLLYQGSAQARLQVGKIWRSSSCPGLQCKTYIIWKVLFENPTCSIHL